MAQSSEFPGVAEREMPSRVRRVSPARVESSEPVYVLGWASNETNVKLVDQWRSLGLAAALISPLEARAVLGPGDLAIGRLDVRPTLDGVEAGLLALLWLERGGTRVLNPAAALLAVHDKLRTARRLGIVGLPHPRTTSLRGGGKALLEPPVVLKPRFGSWGRDVLLCRDRAELERMLAAVSHRPWFRRHGALVQELVPPAGHDLRLVVAGGQIVGAAERVAAPGEWRTNISLGGSLRPTDPAPEARALAIAAAAAVGADLVGVDLMPLEGGGHVILELNGAVEFDMRYSLGGRGVYLEAARALGLSVECQAA